MVDFRMKIPNSLNLSGVRLMLERLEPFPARSTSWFPEMWLSISMGGAVGLLSKWKLILEVIDALNASGSVKYVLRSNDWEWQTYCRLHLNQCKFIYLQSPLQIAHRLPTYQITINVLVEFNMVDIYHWPGCFINTFDSCSTLTTRSWQQLVQRAMTYMHNKISCVLHKWITWLERTMIFQTVSLSLMLECNCCHICALTWYRATKRYIIRT